jgi:hypothetical protein
VRVRVLARLSGESRLTERVYERRTLSFSLYPSCCKAFAFVFRREREA